MISGGRCFSVTAAREVSAKWRIMKTLAQRLGLSIGIHSAQILFCGWVNALFSPRAELITSVHRVANNNDTSNRPALVQHQHIFSQMFNGNPVAMQMLGSEQWPGYTLLEVTNRTHSLTFQQYDEGRYHCRLTETRCVQTPRVPRYLSFCTDQVLGTSFLT